jgi:threonine dehydrogenase-like Zn-dependent dehydrogenase
MVRIEPLISHTYGLGDAQQAFRTACLDENACKVMLKP